MSEQITVGRQEPTSSQTFYVWARDKGDAIRKATALCTSALPSDGKGWHVYHAEASRFPAGKDYNVNWRVELYCEYR